MDLIFWDKDKVDGGAPQQEDFFVDFEGNTQEIKHQEL